MSLVLMESVLPTWIAGALMLLAMLGALAFVLNIGANRPHS